MSEEKTAKPEKAPRIPQRWGTSAAQFYCDCEGLPITVHLLTGGRIVGELVGVDTYDLVIKRAGGPSGEEARVMVAKHAVAYITPGVERP